MAMDFQTLTKRLQAPTHSTQILTTMAMTITTINSL